jgi:hypothetical protein
MCDWNQDTSIGGKQKIIKLPDGMCEHKQNREVCIDSCIVEQIKCLWESGIETLGCCCGHGNKELTGPSVIVAGGVDINRAEIVLRKSDNRSWRILQWQLKEVSWT